MHDINTCAQYKFIPCFVSLEFPIYCFCHLSFSDITCSLFLRTESLFLLLFYFGCCHFLFWNSLSDQARFLILTKIGLINSSMLK